MIGVTDTFDIVSGSGGGSIHVTSQQQNNGEI